MLKKLKQQVTQAVANVAASENDESNTMAEGFLCPTCMLSFASPDQLQQHFDTHTPVQTSSSPKNETTSTAADTSELQLMLDAEKNYSSELKKELERLHVVISSQTQVPQGEVPYLVQQIQMLEAGKALVTERVLELEKDANIAKCQNEQIKRERDRLMGKVGDFGQTIRSKTDDLEDIHQQNELLADELIRYRSEMKQLEEQVECLSKQLSQRPSEDDVNVLKTELVHAQKLMDEVAREREDQISEHLNSIRNLNLDRQEKQCIIENQAKKINAHEEIIRRLKAGISDNENSRNNVSQQFQQFTADIESMNTNIEKKMDSTLGRVEGLKDSLENWKKKLIEIQKCKQNETESLQNKIASLMKENEELRKSFSKNLGLLDEERQKYNEKAILCEQSSEELLARKNEISALKKEIDRLEEVVADALSCQNDLKQKFAEASSKEQSLLQKISEGIGVDKLAMTQLQEEKEKLTMRVAELDGKMRSLKVGHNKELSELESSWASKMEMETAKSKALKHELEKTQSSYSEQVEESKRKMEGFCEMESNHLKQIAELKALIETKDSDLKAVKSICENLEVTISENVQAIEASSNLAVSKQNELQLTLEKLAEVETKALNLDADLYKANQLIKNNMDQLNQYQHNDIEQQQSLNKMEQTISELKEAVVQANDSIISQRTKFEGTISEMDKQLGEKASKLGVQENVISGLQSDLSAKIDEIKFSSSLVAEKEAKINKLCTQIENLQSDLSKCQKAFDESSKASKLEQEQLQKALNGKNKQIEELELKIVQLLENCEKEKAEVRDLKQAHSRIVQQQEENEKEIATIKGKIDKEQDDNREKDEKLLEMMTEAERRDTVIREKQKCIDELEKSNQSLSDKNSKCSQKIDEMRRDIGAREKCVLEMKAEFEKEITKLKNNLIKAANQSEEKQTSIKNLESALEQERNKLHSIGEQLHDIKNNHDKLQVDHSQMLAEYNLLKISAEAFEKQKEEWSEEKECLIAKWFSANSDLDFERERSATNKRNFEDVLSGLQELGRANQTLQMDISRQSSRVWLDDSAVKKCRACEKAFSLTIRKHHCRKCGEIFCSVCSAYTARLASFKNPVRVCGSCFEEMNA